MLGQMQEVSQAPKLRDKVLIFSAAAVFVIAIPYLHIGVLYLLIWVPDKPPIDERGCSCSCFDTIFRGKYEQPGVVPYKHIYFNATKQTMKIWILTVIFILLGYESIKYVTSLLRKKHMRWSMFILFLINLYPNYYSWWSYFNYYNEDFYTYFYHHFYFLITELIVTGFVLHLCNIKNEVVNPKVFAITCISIIHILVSGMDQFIVHVLQGRGFGFQNSRDIALMIGDVFHVIIPLRELYMSVRNKNKRLRDICQREELIALVALVSMGVVIGKIL